MLCNLKSKIIPSILSTISRKLQNQSRPLFYFCQPHSSILNTISRGSHFANYFRIINSLQSICTTTSTLFIKKGVQKLAAFNASTSSSSGACPSVWAASDQRTVCKTTNQMTPPSTTIFTEPQSQSLQSICSFDTNIDYSFRSSI